MSKKKNSKVTIANIVTILGLVTLTFFVFCGQALQNFENNMGTNVIVALVFVLLALFVLWLAVHAKSVENNFRPWRIVETFALLLFFAVSLFTGTTMMKFFVVNENMVTLKETASNDISQIKKLIADFGEQEHERLENNISGYKNAKESGTELNFQTKKYIQEINIDSLNTVMNNKINVIADVSPGAKGYKKTWDKEISELEEVIANWNLLKLPDAVKRIEVLSEEVNQKLTLYSENYDFKIIETNLSDEFTITDSPKNEYKYEVEFPALVRSASGFSITGLLVIILIDILVLASYIFAYRSRKVAPKGGNGTFIGGAPLN